MSLQENSLYYNLQLPDTQLARLEEIGNRILMLRELVSIEALNGLKVKQKNVEELMMMANSWSS
jgi:hypothetical protein